MNLWLHYKDILKFDFLETRYEDIVDDLEGSARRLLEFVDLDWDESVLQFYQSARSRQVHTPSYQGVTQPIYRGSIAKWKHYERQMSEVIPAFGSLIQVFDYCD